ncbi:hypothetical protein AOC19_04290 [Polynucleobacter asymbioticus]|uniref:hypothetical protein n=1 Tax=Polynucleobacter asymbioticus TaxID=576611 RepID=UPI001BFDF18D|nr:hypothetical protein [Polynucleobacter asymbioticus]QWD86084.1 hypothetical protein AOC19_04290 [Polynucleobacter asymbioticus]
MNNKLNLLTPSIEQQADEVYQRLLIIIKTVSELSFTKVDSTDPERILMLEEIEEIKKLNDLRCKSDIEFIKETHEKFKRDRIECLTDPREVSFVRDLIKDNLMTLTNVAIAELLLSLPLAKHYAILGDINKSLELIAQANYLLGQIHVASLYPHQKSLIGGMNQDKRKTNSPEAQIDKEMILREFAIWQSNPLDYPDQETFLKEMLKECKFYKTLTTKTLRQWRSEIE